MNPDELTIASQKKVFWKCSKGHEWEVAIYNRVLYVGF
ncbi:zinc-ribbon domain-containing protein [Neobacillus rhizophilus]|uniref:Zinc-ribbon domain-containing protein n=1 Tax=Neobacillus rhizophilus TaxID=2833579 RepID=A0A942UA87_9BACI|nr:zinc-ribbon domain-containing protein [Neobacillus rhizophilus]MBS4215073.1 zinc-ribbon domain-containing protein [Neobacillus rhizophilus]